MGTGTDWESIVAIGWGFADDEPRFVEYFQEIVSQNPASARAIFEQANALDYLGREAEAIPLYEEALRLELPAEYQAYASSISIFLWLSLYSEGKGAEALKTVMEAMIRNVRTPDMQRYAEGMKSYVREIK